MKKLILIFILTLLIFTSLINFSFVKSSNFGVKRKVLMELFTATWCGPCAAYGPYVDETYNIYGKDKVILLRNQVWNDGLDTEETNNRCNFYGVNGVPTLYVNGKFEFHPKDYSDYRKKIDDILKTTSPISITINPIITSGQNLGLINLKIEVLDDINLKEPHLIVVLFEKLVNYEGPNKEKEHRFVVRDYIYDEVGNLLNLKKGDVLKFSLPLNFKKGSNINDFGIAVWIQDFQTLEVIQAESSEINMISNPTPPVILSPKDKQVFVDNPIFKFLTSFKKIKFEISDKENFSNIILSETIEKNEYEFNNFKEGITYYLRAKSIEDNKESEWSEIVAFSVNSKEKVYSFINLNYNLYGGSLTSIVQNPKNPDILYVGSYGGGVFKSIDGGKSWFRSSFGLESLYVNSIDIDKNNPEIVIAGTNGGVYISLNGGNSWINYGLSYIKRVLISSDSKTLYALSNDNIYKSYDLGLNWIDITPKFSDYNFYLNTFNIDPKNSNKILLSSYHYVDYKPRLYLSNNGGSSWSEIKIKEKKEYSEIYYIEFDPKESNIVYISLSDTGILKSQDGGNSFNLINSPYSYLYRIRINSIDSNILYSSSYNELFISFNSGNSWKSIYRSNDKIVDFINDYLVKEKIYLLKDKNEGLLISNNNGIIWDSSNNGINTNKILGISNINELIVQTNSGLYKIENKIWNKRNSEYSGYGNIFVNSKFPNEIYYYNDYNIFYSNNSGLSWNKTITPPENCYIETLTIDFANKLIYAITFDWKINKHKLYKVSLNNEWIDLSPSNLPLTYPPYDYFASIDPNDSKILYVGLSTYWEKDSSGNWVMKGGGLYKSTDSGKSWKLISLDKIDIYKIFIDPKDSKKIYVCTSEGFKKSTDGGNSWKILFNENVDAMSFHSNLPIIYANRGRNLIKSEDDGLTWKYIAWDYSVDSVKFSKIISLEIDRDDSNCVFIGTDGSGIYKYGLLETEKKFTPPSSPILSYELREKTIYLKWNKPQDGTYPINGFSLYKKIENSDFYLLRNFDKDTFEYIDTDIEFGKTYYYYIQSFDEFNNYSEKSEIVSIYIPVEDTTPPTINIYSPKDLSFLNNNIVTISGIVTDNNKVNKLLINGLEISLSSSGQFNYNLTLNEGENKVLIEAYDEYQNKSSLTLTLYLDTKPPQIFVSLPNETTQETLNISGYVKDEGISGIKDNIILINDNRVELSKSLSFSYSINLKEGDNTITFELEDNAGNKTVNTYKVKLIKKIIIKLQIGNMIMLVDDKPKEIDVPPQIIEGRTYLPIKYIVEPLGGQISWDSTEKKVTIVFKDILIELWIGKNIAKVNGYYKLIDPDNPRVVPLIINGRTMLPVRFVAENLGCKVDWDPTTKTITITY